MPLLLYLLAHTVTCTYYLKTLDVYSMNSAKVCEWLCVWCIFWTYILNRLFDIHNNAKEVSCLLCIVYLNWKLVCCCWHKSNIFGICVWRGESEFIILIINLFYKLCIWINKCGVVHLFFLCSSPFSLASSV